MLTLPTASSAGSASEDDESIRGVAPSVPHVMSCLTAAGPSCSGVGEGMAGRRPKPAFEGERGWSISPTERWSVNLSSIMRYICNIHGVPAMAASIRLRVGLGGSEILDDDGPSCCSGRRVFAYLMLFGSPRVGRVVFVEVLYGALSASGGNINAFRV